MLHMNQITLKDHNWIESQGSGKTYNSTVLGSITFEKTQLAALWSVIHYLRAQKKRENHLMGRKGNSD